MQWPWLLGALVFCVLFCAVGVVLLFDFRGLASRHAKATVQMFRPIRPSQDRSLLERRVRYQLRVNRVVGGAFVVGGDIVTFGILVHLLLA